MNGIDWVSVGLDAARVLVVFVVVLVLVMLVIWAERKIIADMQSRIGPNRAGPFGVLQSLADGVKLFMKEDIIPSSADRVVFTLAPIISMVPAFLSFSVVPLGDTITVAGRTMPLQVVDLNVGILFFLAMGSLSVYGVALAGWSSGSKYPLMGAVRSTAQMISYEIAMGLAVIPVILYAGTMSTRGIVEAQQGGWFILVQSPAFVIFLLAGIAETNRAPFDLPEAETELVAGYHTEYSGVKFAMFFLAEYLHIVTISAVAVTLFWGGWLGPRFDVLPWLWPTVWFVLKTFVFVFLFFWLRASMPRLRYDQLMSVGWKWLIPIGLLWVPFSAVAQVVPAERWFLIVGGIVVALFVLGMFVPAREPEDGPPTTGARRVRVPRSVEEQPSEPGVVAEDLREQP
ncbi:MAG TPA: NADH-quinone oxidoreductase subunit NuoH [Actinomycetota bacterium]|jgi:NADH-quinone oxidoreductase subunit H|nr:NADH-quinone oxidoreductase subunit NuoH [Actinomycetota bacterium]